MNSPHQKLEPSYNAVLDICIILNLQKSQVNIVGMMVVDILLANMLVEPLQYAHRSSDRLEYGFFFTNR